MISKQITLGGWYWSHDWRLKECLGNEQLVDNWKLQRQF